MVQSLAFIDLRTVREEEIVDEWVCVLLRGGGFRPVHLVKVRDKYDSSIHERLVDQQEPYQSRQVAIAEAEDWADLKKIRFIDWP